jgi:Ca2+-binding EF-hand superfamily protein
MKSNMSKAKVVLGILVFLFALSVNAQSSDRQERGKKPPTFKELLKKMDANKDGKLSKKEIKGPLKNDFKKIDTNEDDFISKKEFEKAPKPKRKERK